MNAHSATATSPTDVYASYDTSAQALKPMSVATGCFAGLCDAVWLIAER